MADPESAVRRNDTVQHGNASISKNPDYYLPLYLAAIKGNWEAAETFFGRDPNAVTAKITRTEMTALHVAVGEGQSEFVETIIDRMPMEALALQDHRGMTALHHAAIAGSLRAAVALVEKIPALTNVLDENNKTPPVLSSRYSYENYDVLWYLTLVTKTEEPSPPFSGPHDTELVLLLIASGSPATPSNFFSGSRLGFWEGCIYSVIPIRKSYEPPQHVESIIKDAHQEGSQHLSGVASTSKQNADHQGVDRLQRLFFSIFRQITPSCIQRLGDAKYKHYCAVELFKKASTLISDAHASPTEYFLSQGRLLYTAASFGTTEIIRIILQLCPDLQWFGLNGKFPVHVAIESRRENVFSLFCRQNERSKVQSSGIENGSSILHLAAKRAPLPQILSVSSGAALQMQGEMKWFKEVEKLVHPFIRTWENEEGKTAGELFTEEHKELAESGERWMKDTSNSCLIVATLIATVVFAAAFTVPGGNNGDSGVLIFAITAMMVAFGATLSIVLTERLRWIVAPTALLSSIPVAIFILLQLPLFIQMVRSTFGFTFRPRSPW